MAAVGLIIMNILRQTAHVLYLMLFVTYMVPLRCPRRA